MSVQKKSIGVLSSDGIHTLKGYIYLPHGEVKGILHVVHGMTEHIARYDRFMTDVAKEGYAVCGYDNLGHGYTAEADGSFGYIAKRRGWELLARDVALFRAAVENEVGKLPYYLMGHSMGSFIVRLAAERFTRPDKLIIMGTGGKNPLAIPGLMLIGVVKLFKGDKHISRFLDNMMFGSYDNGFADDGVSRAWLTADVDVRKRYDADKFCTFKFTASALGDLVRLLKITNSTRWYKRVDRDMPILLISGERDPVGSFGKGVREIYKKLKNSGHSVELALFENGRHEILNDTTYGDTRDRILVFIS